VTRSVTARDVVVLSPGGLPDTPARLPDVFDAFVRIAAGMEDDSHLREKREGFIHWAAPASPETWFRVVPVLRDGTTWPQLVPPARDGRITPDAVAVYIAAPWHLFRRDAGWGAHFPIVGTADDPKGQIAYSVSEARLPMIDPLRDAAREDDAQTMPVRPELQGPWGPLLTEWEHVDGFVAGPGPGETWLEERKRNARAASGRLWWQLHGLRDAGDPKSYGREMWSAPHDVSLYLGWPAYLAARAGTVSTCEACHRPAIQSRRYCGSADCDRVRRRERQRLSRERRP
jgi:hypothetical protein